MKKAGANVSLKITVIAAAVALIVAVGLPLTFFYAFYVRELAVMDLAAEINARIVSAGD